MDKEYNNNFNDDTGSNHQERNYEISNPQDSNQAQYPSSQYRYTQDQIKQDYQYQGNNSDYRIYNNRNPYGRSNNYQYGNTSYSNSNYGPNQNGSSQYGNTTYSNYQHGNAHYNNSQYGNTQYGNAQFSSSQYSNTGNATNTHTTSDAKVKPRKKRRLTGVLILTTAAILFGVISGAAFQGYSYLTRPKNETDLDNNTNSVQITESDVDPTVVPTKISSDEVITDVSDVVSNVMPSIVAINSSAVYTSYDFWGRQYNEPVEGSGSGIIIGQNGSEILIVTNNHVIAGAQQVEIVFVDQSTAKAVVKGAEAKSDLAVLSVNLKDLTEETLDAIKVASLGDSDEVQPGQMAIAIGNALGYGQSVTVGYISAVNRDVTIENTTMTLIQTDAAINPGNSGGALLNVEGEVIGINSVKYASQEVEGMGYAIPISDAIPMINELMNRELIDEKDQGFLGIYLDSAQNVTELYAERFNMPIGVYIDQVVEDSPADHAGLRQGHIIVGIDNHKIETIEDILNILSYRKAGDTIDLKVSELENGEYVEKTLKVTLGNK
ncbi:MAG: trypsin-like serine protease [Clostridiales bacterium]|nr:trypsin-like serine protease [Clostridiales bacterium]